MDIAQVSYSDLEFSPRLYYFEFLTSFTSFCNTFSSIRVINSSKIVLDKYEVGIETRYKDKPYKDPMWPTQEPLHISDKRTPFEDLSLQKPHTAETGTTIADTRTPFAVTRSPF